MTQPTPATTAPPPPPGHDRAVVERTAGDRGLQRHKLTLAGWIAVIAEDRGLDLRMVAEKTGLDLADARAVLDGSVAGVPLAVLDRALRRLEGRLH